MSDHHPSYSPRPSRAQQTSVTLALAPTEVRLVRTALHLLWNTYTRHEGLHPAIQNILVRLPPEEQS